VRDIAQVGVVPAGHVLRPVARLPRHRVEAHRCPTVERLQPRRTVVPLTPKWTC
jgi:hypothetical protein